MGRGFVTAPRGRGPRGEVPGPSGGRGSRRKVWARGFVVVSTGRHTGEQAEDWLA